MGDPDTTFRVSGLDHHQPNLHHLNRFDAGRSSYHHARRMGHYQVAQISQASRARVVEVLAAWLGLKDGAPKTSA